MTRWVALLRGVNVGGNKRISMADLRALVEGLGYENVATYVQSGNVVFEGGGGSGAAVEHAGRIERALADELALSSKVLVRSGAEMTAVVKGNPFAAQAAKDPTKVHVAFLSAQAPKAKFAAATADADAFAPDEVVVGARVLYFHHPNGVAGSRLKVDFQKVLGLDLTARNWRTVESLTKLTNPG